MLFGLGTFRGGVHPDGHKEDSGFLAINTSLPLPEKLYLPLCQQSMQRLHPQQPRRLS